jgi:integrase
MARRARRGGGSVFYSKADRRWIARYPLGVVDGRRLAKRVKCRTEDEAIDELEKLQRLYGAGGRPSTETLDEYLAGWLPGHARSIRPSTVRSYRGHIKTHIGPLLGGIPVRKLAPRDVRRLVAELERKRLAPATIHLVVRTLGVALRAAKDDRAITDNPVDGIRLPKVEREPVRALTVDDAGRILDAVVGTWIERPVRVWLGSGLRRGEVIGLDQGDVLDGYVRVRRSKTRVRAVPVSDDAMAALREAITAAPRRGPHEPVFFGRRSEAALERMAGDSVSHALPRILERAGLGHLGVHALRHGAASIMLADGHSMRVIAEQLGHSNPAITARVYAHVVPEAQRAAVASLERRGVR